MPGPAEISGDWSLRRALAIAFTVGIRPCTGAIGVLFFANAIGLMWAGVLSTFAMAVGTAITVSILAALTIYSREAAARLAGAGDNRWAAHVQNAAGLVGAILVLGLGVMLFFYPLSEAAPF
jgi:ABC-type nickel/cobalt efflux system permease component RcnA